MKRITIVLVSVLLLMTVEADAVTSYIGDADGFGFGAGVGLLGTDKIPGERNGTGLLRHIKEHANDRSPPSSCLPCCHRPSGSWHAGSCPATE